MIPRWMLIALCLAWLATAGVGALWAESSPNERTSSGQGVGGDEKDLDKYDALVVAMTIFVLAIFVGYEVIGKVPTTLHTPLMSGSNAISGITVVGAIIIGSYALNAFSSFLGFLAIVLAMINVVGGFLVTHRMLSMFKRR